MYYGVGVNDADYRLHRYEKQKLVWTCQFYRTWEGMLMRCYSEKFQNKQPTYKGCTITEEWLRFSNFKTWMETQDWKGKCLDKDILVEGNKIYSPDTCVFVDQATNNLLNKYASGRGKYPQGVSFHKRDKKFQAQGGNGKGKNTHLGYFDTVGEAHKVYLQHKEKVIRSVAGRQADIRVEQALLSRIGVVNA